MNHPILLKNGCYHKLLAPDFYYNIEGTIGIGCPLIFVTGGTYVMRLDRCSYFEVSIEIDCGMPCVISWILGYNLPLQLFWCSFFVPFQKRLTMPERQLRNDDEYEVLGCLEKYIFKEICFIKVFLGIIYFQLQCSECCG